MGTILASTLIDRVSVTLFDTNNVKWARTEHLAWLNLAMRSICMADPTALNTIVSRQLTAGARQTLPANAWMLLDVYCNMGLTPGTTPGAAVRMVSRKLLDAFNPNWRSAQQQQIVKNFAFDIEDQTTFWVYPPSNGLGFVQLNYAQMAADIAEGTAIPLLDVYAEPIIEFMLGRAYSKEQVGDQTLADKHMAAFRAAIETSLRGVDMFDPAKAFDPVKPGGDET